MRAGTIRNALIVAPLSVLASWEKEAQRVLTAALAVADDDDYDDAFVPTTTVRIRILSSERVPAKQRVRLIQDALTRYVSRLTLCCDVYNRCCTYGSPMRRQTSDQANH